MTFGPRKDIAFHESGHAVARVLSIGRVGITNENAIRWIDMDQGNPHVSVMELPLRPELKEAGERLGIMEGTHWTLDQKLKMFSLMEISPLEWASVRFFEITAGAAAEAKFTQIPFYLVWNGHQCSEDHQSISATCRMIGLDKADAQRLLGERAKEACAAMEKPNVWQAVQSLAEQLPGTGRMPGDLVVSIIQNALRAP